MYDILLTSLPDMDKDKPSPGPAYLKGFLESKGKKVKVIDGNQIENPNKLLLTIDQYDFKWLGISVFSYLQKDIALEIGSNFENVVYGGGGVTASWTEKNFIQGEGEQALLEFLNGNWEYPGINGSFPIQYNDLNDLPVPDYSDQISQHKYKSLIITGSRGCVRNCTFCNVARQWPKYRFVEGDKLAQNMHELVKKYDAKHISFSDSLVNGSMKHFRMLCQELSNNPKKVGWDGQFIARKENQFSLEDFDNLANSGCKGLTIGIESGSEKVRDHMRKKFSNADIDYFVHNIGKRKIPMRFLLIVGYPTETREDFEETKNLLTRYKDYADITGVGIDIMRIEEGTPIEDMRHDLYLGDGHLWYNENSDINKRYEWYVELFDHAVEMGYEFNEYHWGKRDRFASYMANDETTNQKASATLI